LWNGLTLVFLTISLSLIVDAVPRFLSGGLDPLSVLSVLVPSLLALLTSGALTPLGKEVRNYLFQWVGKSFWPFLGMVLSLVLALGLIVFHHSYFDDLALYFDKKGEQLYLQGKWEESLSNYQKAIAFNPGNAQAQYHLGILYEDLQKFDLAMTAYQLAVKQDNSLLRLQAYNNWGRLLILQKKYGEAIAPLLEAKNALPKQVNPPGDLSKIKYALFKNLGWAQLELKNYVEAESILKEAISLAPQQAPAYCLLAQVQEAQKTAARPTWEQCIAYADSSKPDEYLWVSLAREKLKKGVKP
jgi:tetratricopeptide (TPR) repeat protein